MVCTTKNYHFLRYSLANKICNLYGRVIDNFFYSWKEHVHFREGEEPPSYADAIDVPEIIVDPVEEREVNESFIFLLIKVIKSSRCKPWCRCG